MGQGWYRDSESFDYSQWINSMFIASAIATVFILLAIAGFTRYRMQDR
jgi:hypothetical protein